MKRITILTFFALLAAPATLYAQNRSYQAPNLEDLPRRVIDTLWMPDSTAVVLFSNNLWCYYHPQAATLTEQELFKTHWDTTSIFAYRDVPMERIASLTELRLIDDLCDFHTPVTGKVYSPYGRRGRRNHNGVDIPLQTGEPIYAVFSGRVRYSRYNTGGYGNLVIVRHENGLETYYGHLSRRNVESGEYVRAGQVIGFAGNTGRSRGPHLHFECRYLDRTFDPQFLIDFPTGQLRYQTFALEKSFLNIHSHASDQLEEDDDFDEKTFVAQVQHEGVTSEDILNNIARQDQAKTQAGISSGSKVYHTIRRGDTLSGLAVKYGVSVSQLCKLNNITRTTVLQLGRKLRIR